MMEKSEVEVLPVLDKSEIDTYIDEDGFTRIRFSPRPQLEPSDIKASFDEFLGITAQALQAKSKSQLIALILEWQSRICDFKNQFHTQSVGELADSPLGEVLQSLSERVARIMKSHPIKYAENNEGGSFRHPEVIRNILFNLAIGNNLETSANLSGISRTQFGDWRKDDPKGIGVAVDAARGLFAEVASTATLRLLIGGEIQLVEERHDSDGGMVRKVKRSLPDARVAIKARSAVDAGGWVPTQKVKHTHEFKIPTSEEDKQRLQEMGHELALQKAQKLEVQVSEETEEDDG